MPELGNVIIGIKAVDEASSVLDKVRASTSLLGSVFQSFGGAVGAAGDVLQGFAAGGVAGAAVGALGAITKGLEWSIKEATDSEQAFKNLSTAVERSGTAWSTVEGATRDYLSQLQKTTVYSDEALAGMVERLLTFGLSYDQAMKAAGAALDLAAAKHMDLESAATLVGKAVDGNTAVLKRYGVDVELAKDATDKFTPVLTALNEQFGGAAQEQAKTYAGIQERLKNATSELGEKIGGILLPGLASVTEAMIPVVDQFGKGVDAISTWLTEVDKMPEVKAATDAVGAAFQGLQQWFADVGKAGAEILGPALQELWDALREIWAAIQPLFEAFGELWGVFTEGEGSGNALKDVLGIVAIGIRAIADVIKEVAPLIKTFAEAFKEAADFIKPVLVDVRDAIATFLGAVKDAFQAFYDWLIGGSLWQDLSKAVLALTTQMVTQLLNDLTNLFFEPMKRAFTAATDAVKQIWDVFWQATQTTFNTVTGLIKSAWDTWFAAFQTAITNTMQAAQGIWSNAWQAMQTLFTNISEAIRNAWQAWLTAMQTAMATFWSAIQSATSAAFSALQGAFSSAMGALQGILSGAISAMQSAWGAFASWLSSSIAAAQSAVQSAAASVSSTLASMQSAAASAGQSISGAITGAFDTISQGATNLWNWLVGGSIWTDMLEEMQAQTTSALGNIVSDFQGAFGDIAVAAPLAMPAAPGARAEAAATPVIIGPQTISIPVTVTLDGQVISRQVETRIVDRVISRGRKVA